MAQAGKYIIMSSHQMSTVEAYCSEITMLHRGQALLQGNLKRIKAGYGHTRLVLGAPEEAYAMASAAGLRLAEARPEECVYDLPESDPDALCENLLRGILAQGMMPEKFELSEPSLHEIFIKIVGEEEGRQAA
jgi:ABC-2 type transport system ATP-binding protein